MNRFKDYLPEFLGVGLAMLALNFWYLLSLTIHNEVIPVSYDYFIRGFTVLVAAFVGAYSAFRLNDKKDSEVIYIERKAALNKSLFTIIRMINAIKNTHRDLSKYENEFDRAFILPAQKPPSYDDLKFDFEALSFLLDDYPHLLMELAIEQQRFEQTFSSIEIRNNFYVHEVQPALSTYGLNGKEIPINHFAKTLGERLFEGAINGAQVMYYHLEETDKSIFEIYEKFSKAVREIFPNEKFIIWQEEV